MDLIIFLFKASKHTLVLASVLGLASGLSSAGLLAFINTAPADEMPWSRSYMGLSFAGLCVFVTVATILSFLILVRLGQDAVLHLRIRLSRQVLATPLARLEVLGPAKLLVALTDDISALTAAVGLVPSLIINSAFLIGGLIYLTWLSPRLFLVLLGLLFIGCLSYYLPIVSGNRGFLRVREERDHLFAAFRAITEEAKELKLHRDRREAVIRSLEGTADSMRSHWVKAMTLFIVAARWGQLMIFAIIGILIFAPEVAGYVNRQTLAGYSLALLWLMTPRQVLLGSLPDFGRASITVRKLQELGLALPSLEHLPQGVQDVGATAEDSIAKSKYGASLERALELIDVKFTYSEEGQQSFTVGPINSSFRSGSLIFLTGGNGSGKTTLAKLLLGLYSAESGSIRLGGAVVGHDLSLEQYRQNWSAVFSDFFLFDRFFGIEDTNEWTVDKKAQDILELLDLAHKVEVRDGKLSTVSLSQGQRKRLALLTAFLEDRPFYLFDEWAADQDPEYRQIFYRRILPELKSRGKTVFVISHDESYFGVADRTIKLEYGKVSQDSLQPSVMGGDGSERGASATTAV